MNFTELGINEHNVNELKKLDLEPLRNLKRLKRIVLTNNKLKELNLEPLKELEELENLEIDGNGIEELNIEPLKELKNLKIYWKESRWFRKSV